MSILGYSSAYFLPEYWCNTPLYGEKIIPLLDYILSTDYVEADKLANAFYNIESKYKNTEDLPLDQIEAIIDESGYSYVKDLLGNDEDSIRLLVYLLVLIHQLKGTEMGIQVVLNLLRKDSNPMVLGVVGDPTISEANVVSDFTTTDYVQYSGFTTDDEPFELEFHIRTNKFQQEQCIASCSDKKLFLGIGTGGNLILALGNNGMTWNILNKKQSLSVLLPESSYYIKLSFTGYDYEVLVSTDGKKYSNFLEYASTDAIEAHRSILYVGVDNSSGVVSIPFKGYIDLAPFSVNVENIVIQQWFEQLPVGDENTFLLKADLDIGLVSSDFFANFATFVKKYVYPSLAAFEAKLEFDTKLTFLPYVREQVQYVADANLLTFSSFMVKNEDDTSIYDYFYTLTEDGTSYDEFDTIEETGS